VPWANWLPAATHRILAADIGELPALAVTERQGRTVIVSGSSDQSIRIWDLESLGLLRTIDVGAPVHSLAFTRPLTLVVGASMGQMPVEASR
jgi:WD40 repeat protein